MPDNVTPLRPGDFPGPQQEPPFDSELEQAVLGALICDNRALEPLEFLRAEHFAIGLHARLFEQIAKLVDKGQPATALTLQALFTQDTALGPSGISPAEFLKRLLVAGAVLLQSQTADYARRILDLFRAGG